MRRLTDAYFGAAVYKKITKKKDDVFFLFLLDNDPELNYYAIKHAGHFAENKGFQDTEIICSEDILNSVRKLSEDKFRITALSEKQTDHLSGYVLLKANAMGFTILENIRMITLHHPNTGAYALLNRGFFDKEYLVWTKMLCSRVDEYEELIRTTPYKDIGTL